MNEILNRKQVGPVAPAPTRMATVLILLTMAALAIASLIPSHERAAAQPGGEPAKVAPLSVARESRQVGSFAFGYIEFDWDPSAPEGVPGFDSWPPASQR